MIYGDGTTEGEYGRKEEPIGRGRLAGQKEQHKQYLPKITNYLRRSWLRPIKYTQQLES